MTQMTHKPNRFGRPAWRRWVTWVNEKPMTQMTHRPCGCVLCALGRPKWPMACASVWR